MSQKFCNIFVTLGTVRDAFAEILNVTNHTAQWDAELTRYSPSATRLICFHGLEHSLRTHGFRPTLFSQIIKVLAFRAKFLVTPDYCTMVNCTFTFCTSNVSGCFRGVMASFELVKHKFANVTVLHVHLCGFQIIHVLSNAQGVSAPTYTILPTTASICHGMNWFDIRTANLHVLQKYCKTLDSPSYLGKLAYK